MRQLILIIAVITGSLTSSVAWCEDFPKSIFLPQDHCHLMPFGHYQGCKDSNFKVKFPENKPENSTFFNDIPENHALIYTFKCQSSGELDVSLSVDGGSYAFKRSNTNEIRTLTFRSSQSDSDASIEVVAESSATVNKNCKLEVVSWNVSLDTNSISTYVKSSIKSHEILKKVVKALNTNVSSVDISLVFRSALEILFQFIYDNISLIDKREDEKLTKVALAARKNLVNQLHTVFGWSLTEARFDDDDIKEKAQKFIDERDLQSDLCEIFDVTAASNSENQSLCKLKTASGSQSLLAAQNSINDSVKSASDELSGMVSVLQSEVLRLGQNATDFQTTTEELLLKIRKELDSKEP